MLKSLEHLWYTKDLNFDISGCSRRDGRILRSRPQVVLHPSTNSPATIGIDCQHNSLSALGKFVDRLIGDNPRGISEDITDNSSLGFVTIDIKGVLHQQVLLGLGWSTVIMASLLHSSWSSYWRCSNCCQWAPHSNTLSINRYHQAQYKWRQNIHDLSPKEVTMHETSNTTLH